MYFSYFSTPSTTPWQFKENTNNIQPQSIWLCSGASPFPTVGLNQSLYFASFRDRTPFPEALSTTTSAVLPSAQLLHPSTRGGSSSFLPQMNGSYRITCTVVVKQVNTRRRDWSWRRVPMSLVNCLLPTQRYHHRSWWWASPHAHECTGRCI